MSSKNAFMIEPLGDLPMPRILSYRKPVSISALFIIATIAFVNAAGFETTTGGRYGELFKLFDAWREFQKPRLVDGIPDYSASAMAAQHRELADYQRRLAAIDTSGWPEAQRIDYHLVNAEMNGLDFDHRVRRPWERDPAFYAMIFPEQTDVPAREGPVIEGAIELWMYTLPLSSQQAIELAARISTIPKLLEQAKANLTGNARDLWISGIRRMKQQSADLSDFADEIAASQKSLAASVRAAQESTVAFCAWLEHQSPAKTGSSGVGVENYN